QARDNMLLVKTTSIAELKSRQESGGRGKNRRWKTNSSKKFREAVMAKTKMDAAYYKALHNLRDRITEDQTLRMMNEGSSDAAVIVALEMGRQWDRIQIGFLNANKRPSALETRYFIERATGTIY